MGLEYISFRDLEMFWKLFKILIQMSESELSVITFSWSRQIKRGKSHFLVMIEIRKK